MKLTISIIKKIIFIYFFAFIIHELKPVSSCCDQLVSKLLKPKNIHYSKRISLTLLCSCYKRNICCYVNDREEVYINIIGILLDDKVLDRMSTRLHSSHVH